MREARNEYTILVGKLEVKERTGKARNNNNNPWRYRL
jgi:hypothetical protein